MRNRRISELTDFEMDVYSDSMDIVEFPVQAKGVTGKTTLKSIKESIKKELGYMVRVLEKCKHCGQYGAVMCACPHCGAPIDPAEA